MTHNALIVEDLLNKLSDFKTIVNHRCGRCYKNPSNAAARDCELCSFYIAITKTIPDLTKAAETSEELLESVGWV